MNGLHGHRFGRCAHCLHEGSCIVVNGIDANHPSARKLMTMGFDRGCTVKVERVSPFGDPFIVKLKGYSLAVRRKDFEALDAEETQETGV